MLLITPMIRNTYLASVYPVTIFSDLHINHHTKQMKYVLLTSFFVSVELKQGTVI